METKIEDKQQSSSESSSPQKEEGQMPGVFGRSEYAKKDFWDDRFKASKGFFDWYLEYRELKPYFAKIYPIKKESAILMVGCGNSKLSEEMYEDGYLNITNIDISTVVVENMKKHYETKNMNIECLEMDATNMTFKDKTFDVIIDKGTLDALLCGKNNDIVNSLIREMTRVLKLEGELFIISHGQPKARKELFKGAVDINKYEFLYSEQRLSDISQLINIFRSKLKDKPLSQILKDKELLKESIKEFSGLRSQSLAQRILRIKQEMDRKKAQQEEAKNNPNPEQSKPAVDTTEKPSQVVDSNNKAEVIAEKEPVVQTNQTPENISTTETETETETATTTTTTTTTSTEKEEKKEENKEKKIKFDYAPQRQAHCFIYYIKKLTE